MPVATLTEGPTEVVEVTARWGGKLRRKTESEEATFARDVAREALTALMPDHFRELLEYMVPLKTRSDKNEAEYEVEVRHDGTEIVIVS